MDATRIYSNFGPLTLELESRLAGRFGLPAGAVGAASSGTAALIGSILAVAGRASPKAPIAFVPAYTFVATAVAVELCGYTPYLLDVDAEHWMLDAGELEQHPMLGRVGLVVPVAAYGRPVAQKPWRSFSERTGIPVVIDGAASFEQVAANPGHFLGSIPVAMSFHATKSFSTGEGGGAFTTNTQLILKIGQALNFGFHTSRDCRSPSLNGKMSEYHAAVGLAELDQWPECQSGFVAAAATYRRLMDARLCNRLISAPDISSSYLLFRCGTLDESIGIQQSLQRRGVDFRFWYGSGLQSHEYFSGLARDRLAVTEHLAPLILGLPMAPDLADDEIERVASAVSAGIRAGE